MFFLGILNTVGIFFDQNVVSFDPVHLAALLSFSPEGPPALLSPSTLKEGGKKRETPGWSGGSHSLQSSRPLSRSSEKVQRERCNFRQVTKEGKMNLCALQVRHHGLILIMQFQIYQGREKGKEKERKTGDSAKKNSVPICRPGEEWSSRRRREKEKSSSSLSSSIGSSLHCEKRGAHISVRFHGDIPLSREEREGVFRENVGFSAIRLEAPPFC